MSIRVDSNQLIAGKTIVSLYAGHGVQSQNVPATGDNGPSFLYNDIAEQGMLATDEVRGQILTLPAAGTFLPNEDGSFTFANAPDGVYYATYEGYKNGISYGTYTITLEVGQQSLIKRWGGAAWSDVVINRYTGSVFTASTQLRWDGSNWI